MAFVNNNNQTFLDCLSDVCIGPSPLNDYRSIGGGAKKRKSSKRKSHKRKSSKRKSHKRKSSKRKA